jgi:flagellar L-ring protein FlgH
MRSMIEALVRVMTRRRRSATTALAFAFFATVVAGCIPTMPHRSEPSYEPAYPLLPPPAPAIAGGLYQADFGIDLYDDHRAMRGGDIVTIVLQEVTKSSKSAATNINKGSSSELPEPTILGSVISGSSPKGLLNSIENSNKFNGTAGSDQSNSLTGTISAVVTAVYPNGLLQVQGEKWLQLNRGEEYVRVSGLVRREDIDGSNMVSSLKLADARLAYSGTGELADANSAGWLTRFFLSPFMPF